MASTASKEHQFESILPSGRELSLPIFNLIGRVLFPENSQLERKLYASLYKHKLDDQIMAIPTEHLPLRELRKMAQLLKEVGEKYPELNYFLRNHKKIVTSYEDKYVAVSADGVVMARESEDELREAMKDSDVDYLVFLAFSF